LACAKREAEKRKVATEAATLLKPEFLM